MLKNFVIISEKQFHFISFTCSDTFYQIIKLLKPSKPYNRIIKFEIFEFFIVK